MRAGSSFGARCGLLISVRSTRWAGASFVLFCHDHLRGLFPPRSIRCSRRLVRMNVTGASSRPWRTMTRAETSPYFAWRAVRVQVPARSSRTLTAVSTYPPHVLGTRAEVVRSGSPGLEVLTVPTMVPVHSSLWATQGNGCNALAAMKRDTRRFSFRSTTALPARRESVQKRSLHGST